MTESETRLKKHSITLAGHRTSLSLEQAFWSALRDIARREGSSISALVERIDGQRSGNLSSAVRVFVLRHWNPRSEAPSQPS